MSLPAQDIAQLSRLLDDMMDVDANARAHWLAQLPPQAEHLRPALRAMLEGKGLQLPALRGLLDEEAAATPGERVGPYKLLREIGRGGMGSVWLAERADGQYERRVALKLPHRSLAAEFASRGEGERRIVAQLEHPRIARMYDAGVDAQGRPYITMQCIDGVPLDTWCHTAHSSIDDILRLFLQVLDAVAYAHGRRVVHGDIKPGNLLVDAQGQVHLLDFGVARLLEDTGALATPPGSSGGLTRRYASPEQLSGLVVDVASDIYSLGATLDELLTAQPACAEAAVPALPAAPARLMASARASTGQRRRALRGDLDAVLAKATHSDPRQRYASAQALADDLQRYLAGQPLMARRAGGLGRLARQLRKRRAALALAGLAGPGVLLSLGGVAVQSHRAMQATERAHTVSTFVLDLMRLQAAASQRTAGPLAASTALIESRFAQRPDIQADLFGAVARTYIDIGQGKVAAELAARQLQLLEQAKVPTPQLARALLLLSEANAQRGRFAEAVSDARRAAQALPDLRSEDSLLAHADLARRLMSQGAKGKAEAADIIRAIEQVLPIERRQPSAGLATLIDAQGILLEVGNRFDEALEHWRRAIALAQRAQGADSPVATRIRVRQAMELMGRNRAEEARRVFDDALLAMRRGGEIGDLQAAVAASKFATLALWTGQSDGDEVRPMLEASRATIAAWGQALPEEALANVDVRLGVLAMQRGDLQLAATTLDRAVPVAQAATDGLIDLRLLASYQGTLAMALGQHERAQALLQRRLDLRVALGNGHTPNAAFDWVALAHNAVMQGDLTGAERILARAPRFDALQGDEAGQIYAAALPEQRARLLLARGDAPGALAAMPTPHGLKPLEDRSDPILAPYALRGEVLCAAGQAAAGLPILIDSIDTMAQAQVAHSPTLARVRALAGLCALDLGRTGQAGGLAEQARAAFAAQPAVSAWFRKPLARLDAALGAPHLLRTASAAQRQP